MRMQLARLLLTREERVITRAYKPFTNARTSLPCLRIATKGSHLTRIVMLDLLFSPSTAKATGYSPDSLGACMA